MEITSINQIDVNKTYHYADYLLWKFKERVELLRGKIFQMSPAPASSHQRILRNINRELDKFFYHQRCELFFAPFDVILKDVKGEETTVVQPDICVICDPEKLDEKGCHGAPDLVVEILSPGNSKKEMDGKFQIYEEVGVFEYWVVFPVEKCVLVYVLENGRYRGLKPFTEGQNIESEKFPNLQVPVSKIFQKVFFT
ncbi:Uma2 family endonuclease [Capnocytophaga sp.]|uniref:Uma2 family endonuclease n=1 Tax=Capnocytophaga sp. TaxID=44737 RepID=UPI0026DB50EE|nr:Uma2 family endonuclease [Capnocytophaga sp.]MDO5105602.1 Uma2 family endonuclease [Capnocytophaga sp.]